MRFRTLALLAVAFLALAAPTALRAQGPGVILFFGNSLTAGFGLGPEGAFPALVQGEIDARGWPWLVVNAGVSGETSAGGLRRIDWLLRQRIDVLVLELGGNDGLRGIPVATTRANLQAIIDRTLDRYPQARVVIAGMQMPPNLGPTYATAFRELFPALADANDAELIPFLLEGVAGIPELNLEDGIHPTAEGHRIVANNVWAVLEGLLRTIRIAPGSAPSQPEATARVALSSAP